MAEGLLPRTKGYPLGKPGKEGTVYKTIARKRFSSTVLGSTVRAKRGTWLAVKYFKPRKSFARIRREAQFQQRAANVDVAPPVFGVHDDPKCIVMGCGDVLLVDIYRGDTLPDKLQMDILNIMERLDDAGVLHNDGNARNLVLRDHKPWLIDYGFAKELKRGKSNMHITLWALVRSLKRYRIKVPLLESATHRP